MKRKQRTEILVNSPSQIARALAQVIINRYRVTTIEEPNHGLVMVKVRESARNSLFYLGEVFVTECKVEVEGVIGIGMLKGDHPQHAYDLAVIDAAYNAELPETTTWSAILFSEAYRIARERSAVEAKLLKTKVNFETVDTEEELSR